MFSAAECIRYFEGSNMVETEDLAPGCRFDFLLSLSAGNGVYLRVMFSCQALKYMRRRSLKWSCVCLPDCPEAQTDLSRLNLRSSRLLSKAGFRSKNFGMTGIW
jgi:hypothetical protein